MQIDDIEIKWLGHSGFLITPALRGVSQGGTRIPKGHKTSLRSSSEGKIIYIDPYNIPANSQKADLILITHSHYDHCSVADLKKIIQNGTKIVMTADCQSKILKFDALIKMEIVEPGQELVYGEVKISTLPAYNTDKPFHAKDEDWVGYLIKIGGVFVYHAGDTDVIPEMQKLTGHKQKGKKFIALLPIGGRFTMSVEEAVEAAKLIKPDLAIPMHYGSIVGTEKDAQEFVELCKEEGINARVLEKE